MAIFIRKTIFKELSSSSVIVPRFCSGVIFSFGKVVDRGQRVNSRLVECVQSDFYLREILAMAGYGLIKVLKERKARFGLFMKQWEAFDCTVDWLFTF